MQKRMMEASETFLKGSTDFEKPIKKAISLIQDEKWNNADIVFITDGICNLSDDAKSMLKKCSPSINSALQVFFLMKGKICRFHLKSLQRKFTEQANFAKMILQLIL